MSSQQSQPISEGKVILNSPPRKPSRARGWCFTVNNYTEEQKISLSQLTQSQGVKFFIYGYEKGIQGTPHIQGYIYFKTQRTFKGLKRLLPTAHWEKAGGSHDDNYKYCSKDGDFITNMTAPKKKVTREELMEMVKSTVYNEVQWKPWQQEILDIVAGPTHPRKIYWYYETTGNVGKTFIARFLCLQPGTVICEGKRGDVFNQVNSIITAGTQPKLVIVDCPRTCLDFLSYTAIESLKNGLLYSGKYEGGLCLFPSPKVVCFANEPPKREKLSKDRWHVSQIKDDEAFYQR